jgi:hypothetical protein
VNRQDQVVVMVDGFVRRARVIAGDTKWVVCRLIGFDVAELMLPAADEGTVWARGWDDETQGALRAADALKDPA